MLLQYQQQQTQQWLQNGGGLTPKQQNNQPKIIKNENVEEEKKCQKSEERNGKRKPPSMASKILNLCKKEAEEGEPEDSAAQLESAEENCASGQLKEEAKDSTNLDGQTTGYLDEWRPSAAGSALRSRSFLSDQQLKVLADQFRRNPLPSKYELSALAERIGVNKRVVQVWFQNMRAKVG